MSGEGVQECRAPGRRTSSLHMDVRFLAVPEHLYPAAKATYEAQNLASTNTYEAQNLASTNTYEAQLTQQLLLLMAKSQAKKRRLVGAFSLNTEVFSSLRSA